MTKKDVLLLRGKHEKISAADDLQILHAIVQSIPHRLFVQEMEASIRQIAEQNNYGISPFLQGFV